MIEYIGCNRLDFTLMVASTMVIRLFGIRADTSLLTLYL